ncbi:unnamed protein product [Adineta steineri]|uniref:Uncharacterized protein n=1 Tax=Adineta steineri TaxID=433720 RepID=A0A814N6T7_9BILA|nr:unnamed protein product [Adineta steineri]
MIMLFYLLNIHSKSLYILQLWENKTIILNDSKECYIILHERSGQLRNRLFMFASAYGLSLTHSLSDDKNYCRKTFNQNKNVSVTPDSFSAADDLAILTLCQHTILTAGTFGCARNRHKGGREKYLYRPRFVQYLSIHHQIVGLSKEQPSEKHITLAHYATMSQPRTMPGCSSDGHVEDTSIRNRFANRVKTAITTLMNKH